MKAMAETLPNASTVRTGNTIAWLGLYCMAAAILSGILKGVWEIARPILVDPQVFVSAPPVQRLIHSLLEVVKAAGFLAGLFGFYISATRRGKVTKVFMTLAVLGGIFYAGVWMWLTVATRFTLMYVLGGMWYQMIAPVALGIAALFARRIAWWKAVWAIVVGVVNSQIFPLLGPGRALLVQGIIWLIFGYLVYSLRARPDPV
jgi:hypothetical protein